VSRAWRTANSQPRSQENLRPKDGSDGNGEGYGFIEAEWAGFTATRPADPGERIGHTWGRSSVPGGIKIKLVQAVDKAGTRKVQLGG
jgi:hypothetical protein